MKALVRVVLWAALYAIAMGYKVCLSGFNVVVDTSLICLTTVALVATYTHGKKEGE